MKRLKRRVAKKPQVEIPPALFNSDNELAAFVGKESVVTPGDLIFDPDIIDGAVRYWCALRSYFAEVGKVCKPPTQEDMASRLKINRATSATYFNALRATRWLTVLRTIKKGNLGIGYSYLLHDTRVPFDTTIRHDNSYIDFLINCALTTRNKRLKKYAQGVIQQLPEIYLSQFSLEQLQQREMICANLAIAVDENFGNGVNLGDENFSSGANLGDENFSSGANLGDENFSSGENLGDENFSSGENLGDENFSSGENLGDENFNSGENLGDENFSSGENLGDENFNSEDKYNTARAPTRAHAPTPICISVGDNITTTTSGGCVENSSPNEKKQNGDDFTFFETSAIIREIIFDLQAELNKKATHAICNLLKAKTYTDKSGNNYRWIATEDVVIEMLIVLLHDKPNSPLDYLNVLILSAHNEQFFLKPPQQKLLKKIAQRLNPEQIPAEVNTSLPKQSRVEKLVEWEVQKLNSPHPSPVKLIKLSEGQKIIVMETIKHWKAEKGDTATIKKFESSDENDVFTNFRSLTTTVYYDQICKGLELGVLQLCE